jgi:hypothetical protein
LPLNCSYHNVDDVTYAINKASESLLQLPVTLFKSIDYKTTSAIVGCILYENIAQITNGEAIVNPIEKCHPDIVPAYALNASEEELRNFGIGLEVKCTVGNVPTGTTIPKAAPRIAFLNGLTWQEHHQEVEELLGMTYDYFEVPGGYKPAITAAFYSSELTPNDWGSVSSTAGRNTKVCSMVASRKQKMSEGWFAILDIPDYIEKYTRILNFDI